MDISEPNLPPLRQSIATIKRLAFHAGRIHTKQRAEFFEACFLFLCHLRADQSRLLAAWTEKAEGDSGGCICPPPDETPAISSILEDAALFQSFLGMLRSKHPIDASSPGAAAPASKANKPTPHKPFGAEGRKRSGSVSLHDMGSDKHPKLAHSPVSGNLQLHFPSSQDTQQQPIWHRSFNGPVFAATIFFTAFLHLDHWPAALTKAYAEDCFGPRLWVDDKSCSLLVENLALVHNGKTQEEVSDADKLATAEKCAKFYAELMTENPSLPLSDHNSGPTGNSRAAKSTNLDESSSDSDSGDEECVLEVSGGTAKPLKKDTSKANLKPSNDDPSSSSSSGDDTSGDEEVLVAEVGMAPSNSLLPKTPEAMAAAALAHYQISVGAEPVVTSAKEEGNGCVKEDEDVKMKGPIAACSPSTDADASASVGQAPDAPPSTSSIPASPMPSNPEVTKDRGYPWHHKVLDLSLVRLRYLGENLTFAHEAISQALSQRIGAKSKQNSRLLSTLPDFTTVSGVRALAAHQLERWLQSPALSGLARTLFVSIVSEMRNVDPPLDEDVKAIDSILSMKLKANQLNTHIENITTIARSVPTLSISRHIFLRLLREAFANRNDSGMQGGSSNMTFFVSVYESLPSTLAAEALASAIQTILGEEVCSNSQRSTLSLIRDIAASLGPSYDGHLLVKALLEPKDHTARPDSPAGFDNIARIAHECMTLMTPTSNVSASIVGGYHRQHSRMHRQASSSLHANARPQENDISEEMLRALSQQLLLTRKIVLRWCLSTYAQLVNAEPRRRTKRNSDLDDSLQGAGTPDYCSVLDGETSPEQSNNLPRPAQRLMTVIRCLLFLASPESKELQSFLSQQADDTDCPTNQEQVFRVKVCHEHNADLDDETMWIILNAAKPSNATISKQMALTLTEHLFLSCRRGRKAQLKLCDSSIIWELYELTGYTPPAIDCSAASSSSSSGDENSDDDGNARNRKRKASALDRDAMKKEPSLPLPRLAFPGMWWRVTSLALVMCGADCSGIGAKMLEEHPTLQAIIKMTTSGRYRFPTADCDDDARESMKKGEACLREQELTITERLFLPKPAVKSKKRGKTNASPTTAPVGSRVSARQRAKQAKILALQHEKEAAIALAEAQRRKKVLRSAQKSIMVWDPHGPARKPPKDSVGLILSADEIFGVSESLRLNKQPDFLLRTIGCTSRASIERAYDWLIPIISSHPETINRLPSSASCFLLLRAYGAEGDQNNQLLELSAPLLRHVSGCLSGEFGEEDALRAADLLLLDVADKNPDRRVCARRVLQQAVGRTQAADNLDLAVPYVDDLSWLSNLLHVKHASAIVVNAIKHTSHAIAYERGDVLRALLLALDKYIDFAHEKSLGGEYQFTELLCELISIRPHVCCDVLDRFTDVQDLALSYISRTFQDCVKKTLESTDVQGSSTATILSIWRKSSGENGSAEEGALQSIRLPLHVLRASLVLVSNWQVSDDLLDDTASFVLDHSNPKSAAKYLMVHLIIPPRSGVGGEKQLPGAAGAVYVASERRAVPVEQWVMLAKSRCDAVARLAALSAPDIFLPRLLLCSGLPRTSLLSMLERLGKMGDASSDQSKCFGQLLAPSATSEWGAGHLGSRRIVARKLLGRISAYLHLLENHSNMDVALQGACSSSFVKWLLEECNAERLKRARSKAAGHGGTKTRTSTPDLLKTTPAKGSLTLLLTMDDSNQAPMTSSLLEEEDEATPFPVLEGDDIPLECNGSASISVDAMKALINRGDFTGVGHLLESIDFSTPQHAGSEEPYSIQVAKMLLLAMVMTKDPHNVFGRLILKWVPYLTQFSTNASLWEIMFTTEENGCGATTKLLVTRCAEQWNEAHALECHCWILDRLKNESGLEKFSLPSMLRFLVAASGQPSVQRAMFLSTPSPNFVSVGSQEHAAAAVKLALKCAQIASHGSSMGIAETDGPNGVPASTRCPTVHCQSRMRNLLPDWLNLVLLVARCGKKHLALVTGNLVSRLPSDGWEGKILPAALLRLYVYFPATMNLGDSKLRGVLVDAAGDLDWLEWRCPLDDQLGQMVGNLAMNPNQRLLQTFTDLSKRQPLVVMRRLRNLAKVLNEDGVISSVAESRGRIHGGAAAGVAIARTKAGALKVTVRHWGCSFTEPVWAAVLEILSSLPNEVLFPCGLQMGLIEIFSSYVKLIWTQHDLECPENTARLRTKLASLFSAFRAFDALAWAEWMETRVSGLERAGPVRELVKSHAIVAPDSDRTA